MSPARDALAEARGEKVAAWEQYKHAMEATEQRPLDFSAWLLNALMQAEFALAVLRAGSGDSEPDAQRLPTDYPDCEYRCTSDLGVHVNCPIHNPAAAPVAAAHDETLRATVQAVNDNALAWHAGEDGKANALNVIANWTSEALAGRIHPSVAKLAAARPVSTEDARPPAPERSGR